MKKRVLTANGLIPAAQYIRMSTEHQRFSPDNQRAANMAYAAANGYEIVATYQDSGKSGLTLKGRPELKRLLSDVLSGMMPYQTILVLDVSRWGRFQDADQAAHYEYMCREAGTPVRYCSEAFDNDGGAMASIVKHMKRVMAAEYSCDLSKRLSRAQRQQARLGYRQGGHSPYGTRRLVIDENGKSRMILDVGQRKALSTDKVVFARGPASEVAVVRRIFRMYVQDGKKISEICTWLGRRKKLGWDGRPWTYGMVSRVLHNDIYMGVYVYGRRLSNLGHPKPLPQEQWIRVGVMEPIVSPEIFRAASRKLARTKWTHWTEERLKRGLSRLLRERGFISSTEINKADYLPNVQAVMRRFGGLEEACRAIGYEKPLRASKFHVRTYTDQDLLEALLRIHAEHGRLSETVIDADDASPRSTYFARRLGGLKNAYYLAGITQTKPPLTKAGRKPDGTRMTDQEMLDALRGLLARCGYLSTALINSDASVPSASIYMYRFLNLTNVYGLIGYSASRSDVLRMARERRIA